MKEITSKEELKEIIKQTVQEISDTVCYTYGPNGRTVILTDNEGIGIATKDGVSVCNSIHFNDPIKNVVANIVKQVSQKTLEEAGDGTTTSICLTNAFVQKGFELLDQGISFNEIKQSLEELLEYTVKELKSNSKKLTKKDIYNVANVSSNNDKEIASIVDKAFKYSKVVKVEESTLSKTELIKVNGMSLKTTYFSPEFINYKNLYIKYDNSYIALIDGKMETTDCIAYLVNKLEKKPLIIVADYFSDNVIRILKQLYNSGSLDVALIKSPGINTHRKNLMKDIALYTGATLLDPNKKYTEINYLGNIEGIEVKKEETIIFNNTNPNLLEDKISELKNGLKEDIPKYDKDLIKQRINGLNGSASIIKVGGNSPIEIKEKYDRYEDAIGAVEAALEEGIVEGGGIALAKIYYHHNPTKTPYLELSQSLLECYNTLGNDKAPIQKDMFEESIIDPLKVTRCALENAISVAKTILSTEAIVLNPNLWKE